jgi:sentrin-specific protease 1
MNFYLQLVAARNAAAHAAARMPRAPAAPQAPPLPPRAHAFSSFFWTRLACTPAGYDYAAVRRWTKRVDVFSFDLLLVPINHGNAHWCLAALWPRERRLEYFDSLHGAGAAAKRVIALLSRYLNDEAADKAAGRPPHAPPLPPPKQAWAAAVRRAGVPRQTDGAACGVFAASIAARLAAGIAPPFGLCQADVPALRLRIAADCLAGAATALAAGD